MRIAILTLIALVYGCAAPAERESADVLTGLDVLVRDGFAPLRGKRVGLITNHTGIDREGRANVDLLAASDAFALEALFAPEHGFHGILDAKVADSTHAATGLAVYSLYGEARKPTAAQLAGLDVLVFDIQDIGARFYTYISTMRGAMEAAAEQGIGFVVLDRPNPIGGVVVAGPVLDDGAEAFVGCHTLPVRHGMTAGEIARMLVAEREIDVALTVVPVEGWRRADTFEATGLPWVNPSPNMRSLLEAHLYPGIGLLETTNLSVGRGTDRPFEIVGAPWIDAGELAARLNGSGLPGVSFLPLRFTPDASMFKGRACEGVAIHVSNVAKLESVRTVIVFALTLRELYPDALETDRFHRLLRNQSVLEQVRAGRSYAAIEAGWRARLARFRERRRRFLLYE